MIVSFLLSLLTFIVTHPLNALDADSLARTRDEQQRMGSLLRDTISGVLDVQLRQLAENGLADQDIYRDVSTMREHLNQIANHELPGILELLNDFERADTTQRETKFAALRQRMRTIVRRVSTERQALLKRLSLTELAELTRQLILQQTAVQNEVRSISSVPSSRREEFILAAIESQRDIKDLFLQFLELLSDARSRSGPVAVAAADAFRILTVAETANHLDVVQQELRRAALPNAMQEQDRLITSWKEILPILEQAQGIFESELAAAIEQIRALILRQELLRDETRRNELHAASADFIERQSKLSQDIAAIASTIHADDVIRSQFERAETVAMDAAGALLENKFAKAIGDQGNVLGNLLAVLNGLKDHLRDSSHDRSADEMRLTIQSLLNVRQSMSELHEKLSSMKPSEIKPAIDSITTVLQHVANDPVTSKPSTRHLLAAYDTLHQLSDTLALQASIETTDSVDVERSVKKALSAISIAVDDAKDREAAISIGELIRSAEVLERLAADQRALSRQLHRPTPGVALQHLADHQAEVIPIVSKLAEALKGNLDSTTGTVDNIVDQSKLVQQQIHRSIADSAPSDNESMATLATQLAGDFSEVAKRVRTRIDAASTELSSRTKASAADTEEAKLHVEQSLQTHPSVSKLVESERLVKQLRRVLEQQLIANGNTEAAVSLRIFDAVAAAIDAQGIANEAAFRSSPILGQERKALTTQAAVVEAIQKAMAFAEQRQRPIEESTSTDEITSRLQKAHRSAGESARLMLDGNRTGSQSTREMTVTMLSDALSQAKRELERALQGPVRDAIDSKAQANALTESIEAQSIAHRISAEAEAIVIPVVDSIRAAKADLDGNSDRRPLAQDHAVEEILAATEKLTVIMEDLAKQASAELHAVNERSRSLVSETLAIETEASQSIEAAIRSTAGTIQKAASARELTTAARETEMSLARAAADLGAKEELLRQDQTISDSVTALIANQEQAIRSMAEFSLALDQAASGENDEQLRETATKLKESQQQFAEGLRAIGQAAIELSGQREVANRPLREALQLASNLSSPELSDKAENSSDSVGTKALEEANSGEDAASSTQPDQSALAGDSPDDRPKDGGGKQPTSGSSPDGKSKSMGTGFISDASDITAEMMAGSAAKRAMEQALQQQIPISDNPQDDTKTNNGQAENSAEGDPIASENSSSSKLSKRGGAATINQSVKNGKIERQNESTSATGTQTDQAREKEQVIGNRLQKNEAWHAKLPPELRKSIRAGVGQKPPRAYEERLKKYFQSVD